MPIDKHYQDRVTTPKTQCLRCGSVIRSTSASLSRHVAACFLTATDPAAAVCQRPLTPPPAQLSSPTSQLSTAASAPQQEEVLVLIAEGAGPYYLHILATRRCTLADLHQLLVDTWLACCEEGHKGSFHLGTASRFLRQELPSERTLFEVFPKRGLQFWHVYDPREEGEGAEETLTQLTVLGLARLSCGGAEWLAGRPAAVATRNEHPGTGGPCEAEGCQRPAVFRQRFMGLLFEHFCSRACRDRAEPRAVGSKAQEGAGAEEGTDEEIDEGWVSDDPEDFVYEFVDSEGEECECCLPREALLHRWWNSPRTACCGYCGGKDAADSPEEAYPELARVAEEQQVGRVPLTAQEEEEEQESDWYDDGLSRLQRWGFLKAAWGVPRKRKAGE